MPCGTILVGRERGSCHDLYLRRHRWVRYTSGASATVVYDLVAQVKDNVSAIAAAPAVRRFEACRGKALGGRIYICCWGVGISAGDK